MGEAGSVLEKYNKLKTAIDGEVSGALAQAIEAHMQAQRTLDAAEVAAVTGEGEAAEVSKAKRRLEQARANIDAISAKLRGLRQAFAALSPRLIAAYDALAAALPEHYAAVKKEFANEWADAVAAFSIALGKRRAIEAIIGDALDLQDPQPARVDVAYVGEPDARLKVIHDSLSAIAAWRVWDSANGFDGRALPPLVPGAVYRLTHAEGNFASGTDVIEASFEPGRLRHLVAIGNAIVFS